MTDPVWRRPPSRAGRDLPGRADTVIVGGGITGILLLRRIPSAVLIEAAHLAAGASGRNAGFLMAGIASSYIEAIRLYGRTIAAEAWGLSSRNVDEVARLGTDRSWFRRRGSLRIPSTPEERAEIAASAHLLVEDGFSARLTDGGSLETAGDGELDPTAMVEELAHGLRDRIFEGVEAIGVEPGRLETSAGTVRCERILLALNGYLGRLLPAGPVAPIRAQMLAAAPSPLRVERPTYADHGYQYWRQLEDGRLLVGGFRNHAQETEIGYEDAVTPELQGLIEAKLRTLGGTTVTHRWSGVMGFTPDGLPLVGEVPGFQGVFVCGGYNGHGMGFAHECARLLVEVTEGRAAVPAWLKADRFDWT